MLPCEVFPGRFFTPKQKALLLTTDYDVNQGTNIIFLPKLVVDTQIHRLLYHNGGHKAYNAMVKEDMAEIRSALQSKIRNDKNHEKWSRAAPPISSASWRRSTGTF